MVERETRVRYGDFSNGRSIIATHLAFRKPFTIASADCVPVRKSVVQCVKKRPGPSRFTRTQENVERVRKGLLKSPKRSVHKQAAALIALWDLKFHPYKLAVLQKGHLKPLQKICLMALLCSSATRHIFMCQDVWITKTCDIEVAQPQPPNFMSSPCMSNV